jgi:putative endonuclease
MNRRQQAERKGRYAEKIAAWLLRLKGYHIVGMRIKTPVGEVDLIAVRANTLVFVEVKARSSLALAQAALTTAALRRVQRAASYYLSGHSKKTITTIRFDAILVAPKAFPRHLTHILPDGLMSWIP